MNKTRFRRAKRGVALTETALVFPLLAVVILIGIDFGRLYSAQIAVQDAARQGAKYAAANVFDSSAASSCGGSSWGNTIAQVHQEAQPQLDISCTNTTVTSNGLDPYGGKSVTVTASAPFTPLTPLIGSLSQINQVSGSNTERELPTPTLGSCSGTYVGNAAGIEVNVSLLGLNIPINLVTAGPLPAIGGYINPAAVISASIPLSLIPLALPSGNLLDASLLQSSVSGGACLINANSSIASVKILPGLSVDVAGHPVDLIDLGVLQASTGMSCGGVPTQRTTVASLSINGVTIAIPPGINQPITIGNIVSLTLNDQEPNASPSEANAVKISLLGGSPLGALLSVTIKIAHAAAGC